MKTRKHTNTLTNIKYLLHNGYTLLDILTLIIYC